MQNHSALHRKLSTPTSGSPPTRRCCFSRSGPWRVTDPDTIGEEDQGAPKGSPQHHRSSAHTPSAWRGPCILAPLPWVSTRAVPWCTCQPPCVQGYFTSIMPVHPSDDSEPADSLFQETVRKGVNVKNPEGGLACDSSPLPFQIWPTASTSTLKSYWKGKEFSLNPNWIHLRLTHLLSNEWIWFNTIWS